MNYLALALLATVPVAAVAGGVALLVHDPRTETSYRRAVEASRAGVAERALQQVGALLLRPAGTAATAAERVVRRWLLNAGRDARPARRVLEGYTGVAGVSALAAVLLVAAGNAWLGVLALLVGAGLGPLRLHGAARSRQQQIELAAPAMLELLTVLLSAGLTFRHALSRVSERTPGPLGEELDILLTQLDFGWSPAQAIASLTDRCSAPTVVRLSLSARQSMDLGAPVSDALRSLADDSRTNYVVTLRTRAERNVVKGTAALILLTMPPFAALTLVLVGAFGYERIVEGLAQLTG